MNSSFTLPSALPTSSLMSGTETVTLVADHGVVHIPGHGVLATSMLGHAGHDLVITDPVGVRYLVKGFFLLDHPPALTDAGGATVSGEHAVQQAGPANVGVYAQAGGATLGASIGQITKATGTGKIIHTDGTSSPLKVGAPLFVNDTIDTNAGSNAGIVLVDGTTLALDAKGELVLDDLVYDANNKAGGKETVSLIKGAASFVSGQIAHAGQDHMMFKTPVATIGIRGTHVIAEYNPATGDITIVNRPVPEPDGSTGAGTIALFTPTGQLEGVISDANGAWVFNPSKGVAPMETQLTEAQVQNIAGTVDNLVTTIVQQQQQQQNNPGNQGNQGNRGTQGNQGNGGTQGNGGNQGNQPTPPPPAHGAFNANGSQTNTTTTTTDTTNTGTNDTGTGTNNNTFNPGGFSSNGQSTTTTTTTTQSLNFPTQVNVTGDGTVDARLGVEVFTITRVNNVTQTTTVNYATVDGTAHAGTDYIGTSGSVTFQPGQTTATVDVTTLVGNRAAPAPGSFTLAVSGANVTPSAPAQATLAAPPPLPTVTIGNATVSDNAPGFATLTLTLTGNTSLPSTVHYATAAGTAAGGVEFTPTSGDVIFSAGQTTATITVPILPQSQTLTFDSQHLAEAFTVSLSQPNNLILGTAATGTVTVNATPVVGNSTFAITSSTAVNEGDTATITVTRGGDTVGQATVAYTTVNGTDANGAHAGTDYTAASGVLTFAPGVTTETITVPTTHEAAPEPARDFTVVLSTPSDGSSITTGTGTVNIAAVAPPVVIPAVNFVTTTATVDDTVPGNTVTFQVTLSASPTNAVSIGYDTVDGSPSASGSFTPIANGVLNFAAGATGSALTQTITVTLDNPETAHNPENFSVNLTSATGATLGTATTATVNVQTDVEAIAHQAPLLVAAGPVEAIQENTTNPAGTLVSDAFKNVVLNPTNDATLAGIVVIGTANLATQGDWQYSTDNGSHWHDIGTVSDEGNGLVLSANTDLRFVPVTGFTGVADLEVYAVDSTYTANGGAFSVSNATESRVTISQYSDYMFTVGEGEGTPPHFDVVGGSTPFSESGSGIAVVGTSTHWTGADGEEPTNWNDSGNWDMGTPGSGSAAIITTNANVNLSTFEDIGGLQITSSTLNIMSGATLEISAGGFASGSTINLTGDGELRIDSGGTFTIKLGSTINVGSGSSPGDLGGSGGGSFADAGIINLVNGTISSTVVVDAGGQLNVQDNTGCAMIEDQFYIQPGGTLLIKDTLDDSTATVLKVEGTLTNAGTIDLTAGAAIANTDADGSHLIASGYGSIDNLAGGMIEFTTTPGGTGDRELSGYVTNEAGGTIAVNYGATFDNGTLDNSGTISIDAGQQFAIGNGSSGTTLTIESGGTITHTGTGTGNLYLENGVDFQLNGDLTVPADINLQLGDAESNFSGVTVNGYCNTLTIEGTAYFNNVDFESNLQIDRIGGSEAMVIVNDTCQVRLEDQTTIGPSGELLVETDGTATDLHNSGTISNAGLIEITANASENGGLTFGSCDGEVDNLSGGTIQVDGDGGPSVQLQGDIYNESGGNININYNTTYSNGTLDNSNLITLASGGSLTIFGSGATLEMEADSGFSGTGTISIVSGGTLEVNADFTIPTTVNVIVGTSDDDATIEGCPKNSIYVAGTLDVATADVGARIEVMSGDGTSTGILTMGDGGNVYDSGGVAVDVDGTFHILGDNACGTTTVYLEHGLGNSGTMTLGIADGMSTGITLDMSESTNSFANSGTFTIGNDNGGDLTVNAAITNTGTITVASDVYFDANFSGAALDNQNHGTFDVQEGTTATFEYSSGQFLNESGATLTIDGTLNIAGNTVLVESGGTINGSGTLSMGEGGVFEVATGPNVLPGTLMVNVGGGGQLDIDDSADGEPTSLNVSGGSLMVNGGGKIVLEAATDAINSNDNAILDVVSGTLVVHGGGTVEMGGFGDGDSGLGSDLLEGPVTLSGGTLQVDSGAFKAIYKDGTLNNQGLINIEGDSVVTIANGAILNQDAGGTINSTFDDGIGYLDFADGSTFNVNVNTTIPANVTLTLGDLTASGATWSGTGSTLTVNSGGGLNLQDGTIHDVNLASSGGAINVSGGTVIESGGIITIGSGGALTLFDAVGPNTSTTILTTSHNITVSGGTIELDGNGTHGSTLTMTGSAVLTITSNGTLQTDSSTGARTINGSVTNSGGTININTNTTFNLGAGGTLDNKHNFNVASGQTINIQGTGAEFINEAGATLTLFGIGVTAAILDMNGNNFENNGAIVGSGIINMGGGTFFAGEGTTGSTTINPDPPLAPGHFVIDGNAVFGAGTDTVLSLGGTADGQFDVVSVTGHFALGGILDIQSFQGYAPSAGDSFTVVTWGTASGMFDAAKGLVFGGVALDPIFSDDGLTLVARTITQQAGSGDVTLTGSISHDNVLVGGSGNDTLIAGPGNDLLIGGTGNTTFVPGSGNDDIVGGSGTNTADFSSQPGGITVNLAQGTAITSTGGHDTLIGIQNIIGTPFADTIVGNGQNNVIDGGGGADILTGGGGSTTFQFDSPAAGGASITDFASGRDIIALLSSAFNLGSTITAGQNFSSIAAAFNGSNAGVNANFAADEPTLVFSAHDDSLYYDPHGTGPGYTLIAHVEPGAAVAANDIHLFHGMIA